MPRYLKSATISLLNAATEMYNLALIGVSMPRVSKKKMETTRYAPIVALLGSSLELVVKAFLVQGLGEREIYLNKNIDKGKFANINDLIKKLKCDIVSESEWIKPLLYGTKNDESRSKTMLEYLSKAQVFQFARSSALHGGQGFTKDITVTYINDIYQFFVFLSKNKKFKTYLKNIIAPEPPVKDREIIIEDLKRRIKKSNQFDDKVMTSLQNLLLVLPYIPDDAPNWIDTLDNILVSRPKYDDLVYWVQTLEQAHSISLLKNRGGKTGMPVRVEANNPDAIPITLGNFKRRLNNSRDIFYNSVVSANTWLEDGSIDLPSKEHLINLFDSSIEAIQVEDHDMLTAEESWPFLAAAINYQGTPLPCFQFIKYCDELEKLRNIINKVKKFLKGYYIKRVDSLIALLEFKIKKKSFSWEEVITSSSDSIFLELKDFSSVYGKHSTNSFDSTFIKEIQINDKTSLILENYISGDINAGNAIVEIIKNDIWEQDERKVIGKLLDECNDFTNRHAFKSILSNKTLSNYHTKARKRMFFIDFYYHYME